MNILHAECSSDAIKTDEHSTWLLAKRQSLSDMCNSTDAIASKNIFSGGSNPELCSPATQQHSLLFKTIFAKKSGKK